MARHVSTALAVLAATLVSLAYGSVGQAQTLSITITAVQDRASERPALTTPYLFSAADCVGGKTISMTVANVPTVPVPPATTAPTILDFWWGTGCELVANRTATGTATPACTWLFSKSGAVTSTVQPTGITVEQLDGCGAAEGTLRTIYVIAATEEQTRGEVAAYGTFETKFDTVAPAAPTGITAGVGDTAVPVSWTLSTGTDGGSYLVYIGSVVSSGEGGACDPGGLVAGAPPPDGARIATSVGGSVNSADLDLSALGLAIGDSVSVGVVARDAAFNDGVLSQLTCVTRVETCGYICQRGSPLATCSCTVPGAGGAGGAAGAGLLVAALALLTVRLRRSRSAR